MKIDISLPDKKYFHRIVIDNNEVENVLELSTDKLKQINEFILENLCSNEFEDLYIAIGDEIFYRTGEL